jgi:L-lysine 6-transaminase
VRKNIAAGFAGDADDQDEKLGSKVIHFEEAFHGRTGYTMALTHTADPNKYKFFPRLHWPRLPNPKLRFPVTTEVLADVVRREDLAINMVRHVLKRFPRDVAALIIEPIQGEGGDNHFRPEFFQKLREITLENDVMFIVDEVQSGVGMTGKCWAYEHYGIVPDMVAFGKKTQVCGFMSTERIDEVPDNVFHVGGRINSTWGGSLVDMVRGRRYIEIIEQEKLIQRAATTGAFFLNELQKLAGEFFSVSNVRGKGLMLAFDLPDQDKRNALFARLFEEGVLVLKSGVNGIRFRPQLDIAEADILKGMAAFRKVLKTI